MRDNTTGISRPPTNDSIEDTSCDKSHEAALTETTNSAKPFISHSKTNYNKTSIKKKRRNKSDVGENFVAPDGGWGWIVAIASGISMLVTFAVSQQFGIIFRDYMPKLGISSSQLTSIINIQMAVTAITGLLNGPLFRRLSFRQVALLGSILIFMGLLACVFANSFLLYCLSYSCCYGLGRRLTISSSSLAVNTYFKERRRTATAYQYGVAGLGPICLPYVATFLIDYLGVQGTVLFFTGLSLNTVACSLIYQPVKWHVKTKPGDAEASKKLATLEADHIIIQSVEPENDYHQLPDNQQHNQNTVLQAKESEEEKAVKKALIQEENERCTKLHWYTKVVLFFDLGLLRDFTYVNLAIGLTLINFVELNFAILTPFILSDFGFHKNQIALAMSVLGTFDLIIRFLIPLITAKIILSNKTFFILGILGMCIGRLCLSFTRNFHIMIAISIWLGLSKAFRTVFWSLIIPGYVPLKRLPAAAGLQLLMSGLFSLAFGPLIGLIRDNTNYAFALNFLNVLCLVAIAGWLLEAFVRKYSKNSKRVKEDLK